ncbi:hypothetical protein Vadar_012582 [Vaccinium darrowii]|uniref:Uncharacterized protein n=1 Tax=Vaccinium darrowii TaxID=229202 RepID=A0ACB7Y6Y2_9ERIC|nr:hypothetical protein Vadar_012582 [Vaccinium darrowii]
MSCFCGERRGLKWKQSWGERTLASIFETPIPLLVLVGIALLLVSTSWYLEGKAKIQQAMPNFQLLLILCTVVFILFVHVQNLAQDPRPVCNTQRRWNCGDGSPWVVAAVVVFLLVLVSFKSSLRSKFFKLL